MRVLEGKEWAPAPRLPRPLRDAGVVVLDEGILVAGGLGVGAVFGPSEWLRDVWWLGAGDDRWRARERLPAPRAGGRGFVCAEGRVGFVGGRTPEGEADGALIWDSRTDAWTTAPCGPPGIGARGMCVLADGSLVLAGGHRTVPDTSRRRFGPDHHPVVARCHRVDPSTGRVTPLPDLAVARRHAAVVAVGPTAVLVMGGEINGPRRATFRPIDVVERIDVADWSITPAPPLTVARSGAWAAHRDGRVLVVGGRTAEGGVAGLELREISRARRD
ncbi:MAG: hypothetical protein AAF211_24785 [Myxococcota bacterium]